MELFGVLKCLWTTIHIRPSKWFQEKDTCQITQKVLSELKKNSNPYIISWVSTCDEPDWAKECLQLFRTLDGKEIGHLCHPQSSMICKANKRDHFQRLKKLHSLEEMIFFDNQMNNIHDVSKLGVQCIYYPDGITANVWCEARKLFPDLPDMQ